MILSDRTIREELKAGRIVIEPLGDGCIQPSSVDLHLDRYFRVFLNHTMGHIDPKEDLENLTELVEVPVDGAFVLHPGEFVLGSTRERVGIADDLVARLEGKSSLGRLGLLIHSSLPASETVLLRRHDRLEMLPIGDVVRKSLGGDVVAFDPVTLEVGYHAITGWYEGPPDRIYEIRLASGRSIRVTAGHNLFTLTRTGDVAKVRTNELVPGARVAVPARIPDPLAIATRPEIRPALLAPEAMYDELTVTGPTVARHATAPSDTSLSLADAAQQPALLEDLTADDALHVGVDPAGLPAVIEVSPDRAWLIGAYVAGGTRREAHPVWAGADPAVGDRIESVLRGLGLHARRGGGEVRCESRVMAHVLDWIGAGEPASERRVAAAVLSWPRPLVAAFLDGVADGTGAASSAAPLTPSGGRALAGDLLLAAQRLGFGDDARASIPLPDLLLQRIGAETGLGHVATDHAAGPDRVERPTGRDTVARSVLRRLRDTSRTAALGALSLGALDRLVDGDLMFDVVEDIVDTSTTEAVFDLEVRPGGAKIENFVAGSGGVLVSNTAGFVDAGWDGHLTLELSNVLNLPIKLYPGMKIGQISFLRTTSPVDMPYGAQELGSKYQGQRGPTPSRYWENFKGE